MGQGRQRTVALLAGADETVQVEVPKEPDAGGAGAGAGGAGAGGAGPGGAGAGGAGAGGAGPGPSEEPAPLWPAIVLGTAGGVLLLGGVGLTIARPVLVADAERTGECAPFTEACLADVQSTLDTADAVQNVGLVAMGLGGASLAAMAIYLAVRGAPPPVLVVPNAEKAGLGFTFLGEF